MWGGGTGEERRRGFFSLISPSDLVDFFKPAKLDTKLFTQQGLHIIIGTVEYLS